MDHLNKQPIMIITFPGTNSKFAPEKRLAWFVQMIHFHKLGQAEKNGLFSPGHLAVSFSILWSCGPHLDPIFYFKDFP